LTAQRLPLSRVNNLSASFCKFQNNYREYFTKENHSADERAQHEEQIERVNKIREELLAVVEKTAA
jgi:hypothetical protein